MNIEFTNREQARDMEDRELVRYTVRRGDKVCWVTFEFIPGLTLEQEHALVEEKLS